MVCCSASKLDRMLRKLLWNKLHQSGYNAELDYPEIDYCGWGR
jgi:hypothetical protein